MTDRRRRDLALLAAGDGEREAAFFLGAFFADALALDRPRVAAGDGLRDGLRDAFAL